MADGIMAGKYGHGGARAGAGRKPKQQGVYRPLKPVGCPHAALRLPVKRDEATTCFCGEPAEPRRWASGRAPKRCASHVGSGKSYGCAHPKPLLKNGRERKVCFECAPKPDAKPRRPWSVTPRAAICPGCGAGFTALNAAQKFCARICAERARNAAVSEARRRPERALVCPCGSDFTSRSSGAKFCSDVCRKRSHWARQTGNTHKRRARKFGGSFVRFDPLLVLERDGWACQVCGIDTPKALRGMREHNSPELDHIVPLALGGDHSPENAQCACRSCNMSRGAKTMDQFIAQLAA